MDSYSGLRTKRLMEGDQDVFMELFNEYYDQLRQYALQMLKTTATAEAILDKTFNTFWDQRQALDPSRSLEEQLLELVVEQVLKVLLKTSADPSLKAEVWKCIKKIQHREIDILPPVERNSVLKVIHNNLLQQQLLNELATTRR